MMMMIIIIIIICIVMIEKLIKQRTVVHRCHILYIFSSRFVHCYNLYYRKVEVFWSSGYVNGLWITSFAVRVPPHGTNVLWQVINLHFPLAMEALKEGAMAQWKGSGLVTGRSLGSKPSRCTSDLWSGIILH